jgi:hypothetical protein
MATSNTHVSKIEFKRSSVPDARPTSLLPGEPAINITDGKLFFQLVNGKIVNVSSTPVGNTYYVSAEGNDIDDGLTPSRALKTIRKASMLSQPGDSIVVSSGHYIEKCPIIVPQYVQVQGAGERNCFIQPTDPTKDVFWVNNNSYVTGFKFADRTSAAIAFPDEIERGIANGVTSNTITLPSTSESIDGYYDSMEITITSGNAASLIYNKDLCSRDVGYIVDSISFDTLYGGNRQAFQSAVYYYGFTANSVTVIPNEVEQTTNAYIHLRTIAGQVILGQNVVSYQDPVEVTQNTSLPIGSNTEVQYVRNSVNTIINIINSGPSVANTKIPIPLTPSSNTNIANTVNILQANRDFFAKELTAYIHSEYRRFNFNTTTCERDTRLIIDSLSQDLLFQTDSQSNFAGLQYWSKNNYTGNIASELSITIGAYNYAKNLCSKIILNDTTGTRYQNLHQQHVGNLIYSKDYCGRDVGYIVDSISFDLVYGGNRQSYQSGVYYFGFDSGSTTVIPGELTQTTAAYNHLKTIAGQIILGQTVTTYQNTITQNTSIAFGTATESANVANNIDYIINIITNGPSVANTKIPMPLTKIYNANEINAANILEANRTFIVEEVIAYIGNTYPSFSYDQTKCRRDTGLVVDAVAQDLLFQTKSQSTFTGLQYWSKNNYTGKIGSELTITVDAINYAKNLCSKIILNDTTGTRYQTELKQRTANTATSSEVVTISTDFDYITTIINSDGTGISDTIIPNSLQASSNTNVLNAYNLLKINKRYIQAEVIGWVEANKSNYIFNTATQNEVNIINTEFNYITNILANGTIGITDTIVPNGYVPSSNTNIINAYNLLQDNKDYIRAEVVAWVESNKFMNQATVVSYNGNTRTALLSNNWPVLPDNNCGYYIRIPLRDTPAPVSQRYTTFIVGSPYIYNCSSISPYGTGIKIDGSLSTGNKSMVSAQFTQFNANGTGIYITNDGYSQLVGIYAMFCDRGFVAENGGTASLGNCNLNFGNYGLVSIGKGSLAMTAKLKGDSKVASKTLQIHSIRNNPSLSVRAPKPYSGMIMKVYGDPDPAAYYIVEAANTVGDITTVTFALRSTKSFLDNTNVYFYQQSQLRASGQTYEYVGAGTEMQEVLPKYGGVLDPTKQTLMIDEGVVYATATDQNGNFIVSELSISQATSSIVGRTFEKSLFAQMTPYILAIQ